MHAHTQLAQSLFQEMLTTPEPDMDAMPWDNARNVEAGKSTEFEPTGNAKFDALVRALAPSLRYGEEGPPLYDVLADTINMPHRESFANPVDYLSTFAHELSHWTMLRVGRVPHLGDRVMYGREEMTADIACAIVMAECDADPVLDARAKYVRSWLVGTMDGLQEWVDGLAAEFGEEPPRYGRAEIDHEYGEAVARAERAAAFILSAGSPAATN